MEQTARCVCTRQLSLSGGLLRRDGDNIGLVGSQYVTVTFCWEGPQVT